MALKETMSLCLGQGQLPISVTPAGNGQDFASHPGPEKDWEGLVGEEEDIWRVIQRLSVPSTSVFLGKL